MPKTVTAGTHKPTSPAAYRPKGNREIMVFLDARTIDYWRSKCELLHFLCSNTKSLCQLGRDLVLGTSPMKGYAPRKRLRWTLVAFMQEANVFLRLPVCFLHQNCLQEWGQSPGHPMLGLTLQD